MIFGRKQPEGKTLLIVDVEQGSVGAALVRLEQGQEPRLFGATREHLRTPATRDSVSLLHSVGTAAHSAIKKVAEVAARLRNAPTEHAQRAGAVSGAVVFLAAPWGTPNLAGSPVFVSSMEQLVRGGIAGAVGGIPANVYTAAGGALGGVRSLLPYDNSYVLCNVGAEITELMSVVDGTAAAYGTVPQGRHSIVRTLRTHGGLSDEEARSLMRMGHGAAHEAAAPAAAHYAEELADVTEKLLSHAPAQHIYVLSHDRAGEWIARTLSENAQMADLFPHGGVVRALSPHHVSPLLHSRPTDPDLHLGLEAIFTNNTLQW